MITRKSKEFKGGAQSERKTPKKIWKLFLGLKKSWMIFVMFFLTSLFFSHSTESQSCSVQSETLGENLVEIDSYISQKKEKGKILILPPTKGVTYFEKKYAQRLCKKGFSAFIIKSWKGIDEEKIELNIHNRLLGRAQTAILEVLNKKTKPEDFIGLLGTSVGAIHSATALGFYPQIQAGFLIVGGAPIHQVIAYSKEDTLTKYRNKRMKKFQFQNVKDYALALDKVLIKRVRPLAFVQTGKNKAVFTVTALKDQTVPTENQKALSKALNAENLNIPGGHIFSIIWFYLFHKKKVIQFFEKSLKEFHKKN